MTDTSRRTVRSAIAGLLLAVLLYFAMLLAPTSGEASTDGSSGFKQQGSASAQDHSGSEIEPPPSATNYIVGGSESNFQRHPWLVQITLNGGAFCGGALVHPMLVLTAAHCLWSGEHNTWWPNLGVMQAFTSRTTSETGGEELSIAGGDIASNYNPSNGENDYGLLVLETPSSRPILKVAGPSERAVWKPGRTGLVAGFGNIAQGGAASPVLKELSVPLLADSVCGAGNSYGADFRSANMLCAGIVKGGSGTCQGDSGGPLSVPIDGGGRRIVGVVSWGDGCAKPNKPTLYARVADPSVSTQINALAAGAAQTFNFPGTNADANVLGSGAKPVGCAAATKSAKKAKKNLTKARQRLKKAKRAKKKSAAKAVKRAAKANRAATKKVKSTCS